MRALTVDWMAQRREFTANASVSISGSAHTLYVVIASTPAPGMNCSLSGGVTARALEAGVSSGSQWYGLAANISDPGNTVLRIAYIGTAADTTSPGIVAAVVRPGAVNPVTGFTGKAETTVGSSSDQYRTTYDHVTFSGTPKPDLAVVFPGQAHGREQVRRVMTWLARRYGLPAPTL